MTEPNSHDEDAVVAEVNGDDSEVETEAEEEEEVEVVAEFAIILYANLNGMGVNIEPVENPQVNRKATIDDIVSLIGLANSHMQANINAAKVAKLLSGGMKKKIHVPGIRGARG